MHMVTDDDCTHTRHCKTVTTVQAMEHAQNVEIQILPMSLISFVQPFSTATVAISQSFRRFLLLSRHLSADFPPWALLFSFVLVFGEFVLRACLSCCVCCAVAGAVLAVWCLVVDKVAAVPIELSVDEAGVLEVSGKDWEPNKVSVVDIAVWDDFVGVFLTPTHPRS